MEKSTCPLVDLLARHVKFWKLWFIFLVSGSSSASLTSEYFEIFHTLIIIIISYCQQNCNYSESVLKMSKAIVRIKCKISTFQLSEKITAIMIKLTLLPYNNSKRQHRLQEIPCSLFNKQWFVQSSFGISIVTDTCISELEFLCHKYLQNLFWLITYTKNVMVK